MSLLASSKAVRAWPGGNVIMDDRSTAIFGLGTGAQKVGGNYGPTLLPLREAVSVLMLSVSC